MAYQEANRDRITVFRDDALKRRLFQGENWDVLCHEMVRNLPEKVYISFDIDGLHPALCPHTGTPVPGGLSFEQAMYVIETVVKSGRQIVGGDLVEVAPGPHGHQWDGNVGSRVLMHLLGWMGSPVLDE